MNPLAPIGNAMLAVLGSASTRFRFIANLGVGLGSWRDRGFFLLMIGILAIATWGDAKSFMAALSGLSFFCLLIWWSLFVSEAYRVSTKVNLQLTPRLRLVLGWLVILVWSALALLFTTGFFLGHLFFAAVGSIWLAISIFQYRKILLPLALVGIAVACWSLSNRPGWFMANDSVFYKLEVLTGMWAVAGSLLALIGVTRVYPLLGGALWVLWIGAMLFSKPLVGFSFTELLHVRYAASSQIATHFATAVALFGLMLYGIVVKQRLGSLQDPFQTTPSQRAGNVQRGGTPRFWIYLTGYNRSLSRAIVPPYQFSRLLPLTFGRSMHLTTICWAALGHVVLISLVGWMLALKISHGSSALNALPFFMWALYIPLASILPSLLVRATYRSRRVHQLLTLTPGWPQTMTVNRQLAGLYAKYCAIVAASALLPLGVIALVRDLELAAIWRAVGMVLFISTLQYAATLRRYEVGETIPVALETMGWIVITIGPAMWLSLGFVKNAISVWVVLGCLITGIMIAWARYQRFIGFRQTIPAAQSEY